MVKLELITEVPTLSTLVLQLTIVFTGISTRIVVKSRHHLRKASQPALRDVKCRIRVVNRCIDKRNARDEDDRGGNAQRHFGVTTISTNVVRVFFESFRMTYNLCHTESLHRNGRVEVTTFFLACEGRRHRLLCSCLRQIEINAVATIKKLDLNLSLRYTQRST